MIELALALALVGLLGILLEPVIARSRRRYFEESSMGRYIRAMQEQIAREEEYRMYLRMQMRRPSSHAIITNITS